VCKKVERRKKAFSFGIGEAALASYFGVDDSEVKPMKRKSWSRRSRPRRRKGAYHSISASGRRPGELRGVLVETTRFNIP
jgi:hypothetical protein